MARTILPSPLPSPVLIRIYIFLLVGTFLSCLWCLLKWTPSTPPRWNLSASSPAREHRTEDDDDDGRSKLRLPPPPPPQKTNDRYEKLCGDSNRHDAVGWEFAGPTTYINHWEVEEKERAFDKSPPLPSAAAVQQIVSSVNDTWFIASVNGGVWRSKNISPDFHDDIHEKDVDGDKIRRHRSVSWENVLDGQPVTCSSMSVLHVSKTDPSTVYAGCGGSTSSEQGWDHNVVNSGDWSGIMVSHDVGETWEMIEGFPENYFVTDILEISIPTNQDDSDHDNYGGDIGMNPSTSSTSTATATSQNVLLVSAQSHLWNSTDGGVWRSEDGGMTFERTCYTPTFTLTLVDTKNIPIIQRTMGILTNSTTTGSTAILLATHAHSPNQTASLSKDGGLSFVDVRLPWKEGAVPFYTCATQLAGGTIIVGGLTRLPNGLPNNTDSQIFVLDGNRYHTGYNDQAPQSPPVTWTLLSTRSTKTLSHSWIDLNQPMRLDQDSMPKDRMALMGDPDYNDLFYVAGNAEALAWRVNMTTGEWTKLWDEPDVLDGSIPHGDCRNFAWDDRNNRLLLVSDGGVFARVNPRSPGGFWLSLNGNYSAFELISAHYDYRDDRYIAGAQDNCAIVTKKGASAGDTGIGFVMGDGTVTMVDSDATPSRLFGTTQFLGVGTIENDPEQDFSRGGDSDDGDDDDEGCGGLCFVQGDKFIQVPVEKYFSEPSSFPFFVHPFTLNRQNPTKLLFWVNGTESGIFEFDIDYAVKNKDDIDPPTKVVSTPKGEMIMDFVSGGVLNGVADPNLIVAVSNSHLFFRSGGDNSLGLGLSARPLPVQYALPVTLQYDESLGKGSRILGPLSHARTVFMHVMADDSRIIAITGWTTIETNEGDENIFLTRDGGMHWDDITGNLLEASGVSGKVRPSGMQMLQISPKHEEVLAVLVGTSNGIFVTFLSLKSDTGDNEHTWVRYGNCKEFPIVLVADIDNEPVTDRLVASTYGRGIYIQKNATNKLHEEFERSVEAF